MSIKKKTRQELMTLLQSYENDTADLEHRLKKYIELADEQLKIMQEQRETVESARVACAEAAITLRERDDEVVRLQRRNETLEKIVGDQAVQLAETDSIRGALKLMTAARDLIARDHDELKVVAQRAKKDLERTEQMLKIANERHGSALVALHDMCAVTIVKLQ